MYANPIDAPTLTIGRHEIGPGHPVFIVAELSANHRQDFDAAVRLIHAAKASGADAVKLQTYTPDTMTIDCNDRRFRHGNGSLWAGKTLYELYQEAFMPWEWQPKLKEIANNLGLELFSSAYDPTAVEFLAAMNVPAIKISSFELVDLPLIRRAAGTGKPLIISTGMGSLAEIDQAVTAARSAGATAIVLLKCTSAYPCDPAAVNLVTIPDLAGTFNLPCGLSDHSQGSVVAAAAVALGACLIEKHFKLEEVETAVDSAFSLTPKEFRAMVDAVRTVQKSLGTITYGPEIVEKENVTFRRSLYAVEDIVAGGQITESNVRAIRPSGGLPPGHLAELLGKITKQTVKKGTPITWDVVA
ncbi:MAG: pseudaminic acid synthase [Desulfobacterales bacterium]|nr:MAG: pseudaminic acid synthase [Desulfobacterales bacterium]